MNDRSTMGTALLLAITTAACGAEAPSPPERVPTSPGAARADAPSGAASGCAVGRAARSTDADPWLLLAGLGAVAALGRRARVTAPAGSPGSSRRSS